MTSYQELTAGGESSLLFTGCCRAKEVTDRDLDCRTQSHELRDEARGGGRGGEAQFQVGLHIAHPRYLTAFNSLTPCPPLHPPPLPPHSTPATTERSGRVLMPCPLAAQGQSSPGPGRCASKNQTTEETLRSGIGALPQHVQMDLLPGGGGVVVVEGWWGGGAA